MNYTQQVNIVWSKQDKSYTSWDIDIFINPSIYVENEIVSANTSNLLYGLNEANNKAEKYIEQKIKTADSRNRNASTKDMILEQGDFIKGINAEEKEDEEKENIKYLYLRNILQNGSVSKEYLGSDANSDCTPLDTDVSMILNSEGTIREKMNKTVAADYGPIWFVLKNNESDNRFITTRTSYETEDAKRDMSKMEVFLTGGEDHYGIRTGFASSEINYIVMENYNHACNYTTDVYNLNGEIVYQVPNAYRDVHNLGNGTLLVRNQSTDEFEFVNLNNDK